ncbi:MAG: hypothetical protein V1735_06635 [Nanoarchaeota archaeon]
MGRTVLPQRNIVQLRLEELRKFRHALRKEDQGLFDRLLTAPTKYISAITYANSLDTMDFILLCMILEQARQIEQHLNTPPVEKRG